MDFLGLTLASGLFLLLALGLALGFEMVNGFHDTANAVATVIYTHSLKPNVAVVWSGIWNFIGVLASSGAVAYGIVALLPVELVLNTGSSRGFAMVFALLISAIIWNLGTWYLGLPASSSHTLIGSILGVGLANSLWNKGQSFGEGVNWAKAGEVFTSLFVSPIIGFTCAAILFIVLKKLVTRPELYKAPEEDAPPPWWIRAILIFTCTGVSFAHGSNDGQKGMGLIVLILVGILPGIYALDLTDNISQFVDVTQPAAIAIINKQVSPGTTIVPTDADAILSQYLRKGKADVTTVAALDTKALQLATKLNGKKSFLEVPASDRRALRSDIYLVNKTIDKLLKGKKITDDGQKTLATYQANLKKATEYIPTWVKAAVALALGCGTMIGWKRIVVTVGEKIGKEHLTYAQGASAELVAMSTIIAADHLGLPVSTTHVLSSGIAGTMTANGSGLQTETVRNIALAWILTLPVSMLLGATLFEIGAVIIQIIPGLG
jgi:inorganic phosphate transporter, PiT family